ncbi:MAG: hypothetical protein ACREMO_07175 [Gemmatimonadales bacterium]
MTSPLHTHDPSRQLLLFPMTKLLAIMAVFIEHPWLAMVIGGVLLGLGRWRARRIAIVAGGLWVLYGLYETGMRLRWLCSGECNIRVDLLMLDPLLALATLVAAVSLLRRQS